MKRNPLKIAIFLDYGWLGRALRLISDFARYLSQRHKVDVYTSCQAMDIPDFKAFFSSLPSCKVIPIEKKRILLKNSIYGLLSFPALCFNLHLLKSFYRNVANEIDRQGYDIVLLDFGIDYFGHIPYIFDKLKAPVVYYCHEPNREIFEKRLFEDQNHNYRNKNRLQRIAYKMRYNYLSFYFRRNDQRSFKKIAAVLCNSYYTREYLYQTNSIFAWVSYPGVDVDRFQPLDTPCENLVLTVGELSARKRQDFIIRALSFIPAGLRPRLAIVYPQDNKFKDYLQKLAYDCNVNLEFHRHISDDDLIRLYNRAKLTLQASLMEPFGLVPVESLSCGTPVVAVCEGGVRETIINGQTGILVQRDPESFAQKVQYLLENEPVRLSMARQARQDALARWSIKEAVDRLEGYLYAVVEGKISNNEYLNTVKPF